MAGRALRGALAVSKVVGQAPGWSEPRLAGGWLFWLERRPAEGGRTTLLSRPLGDLDGPAAAAVELTPGEADLRSRVHDYGGGVYAVGTAAVGTGAGDTASGDTAAGDTGAERTTVVWVNDADRCLWSLELPPPTAGPPGAAPPQPRRLTLPEPERRFADGLIDARRQRWIGVLEQGPAEALVQVPLAGGEPQQLRQPADFCGYATLSPDGRHLAWVEWERPWMPWERSQLWLGRLTDEGGLEEVRRIAGSGQGDASGVSVFQPLWIPAAAGPAHLVVATDRSGWWNLDWLEGAQALPPQADPLWRPLLPLEAEFGMPQWVYGMRTTAWDGESLVAAACRQGRWELGRLTCPPGGGAPATAPVWLPLALPFDELASVVAENGRMVAIAASPSIAAGLLELDRPPGAWRHTPASPQPLAPGAISQPEALWFSGAHDQPTHAWYYPPTGGGQPGAPLLVRAHSGPTAMARTGLNLTIQFWTSRGWGVVDVNYGGSTGFGRAYRERLDGQWGVVDVADCTAAARALVAAGRADPDRIAMEGGSAAGFTVLAMLCFSDVLRAGACRYAVADLEGMAQHTHRFEARYFDTLVGPWPAAAATYRERSPLRQAERIGAPVIFFQGLEDRVVPPEQTERMALALGERGIPVEVHLFPGEGHGFRTSSVQQQVLEASEAFFRRHFDLP